MRINHLAPIVILVLGGCGLRASSKAETVGLSGRHPYSLNGANHSPQALVRPTAHTPRFMISINRGDCELQFHGKDVVVSSMPRKIDIRLSSKGINLRSLKSSSVDEVPLGLDEMYVIPLRPGVRYIMNLTPRILDAFPNLESGDYRIQAAITSFNEEEVSRLTKRFPTSVIWQGGTLTTLPIWVHYEEHKPRRFVAR